MTLTQSLLTIALLIATSAFFSMSEIALAASRRVRLRQMLEDGDKRAEGVMHIQSQPGEYFTVTQIGLNAVAILGGVVGEGALSPYLTEVVALWLPQRPAQTTGFLLSFVAVTSLFILFADLLPKRVSMAKPEALAVRLLQPMLWCMLVLKPLVWLFDWLANAVVKIFRLPAVRDERITSDDILAMTKDGTRAGVLAQRAQQVIANVMDMNSRTVPSAMTQRDRIAYFLRDDPDHIIRARIAEEPYSTYPVCDGDIDHVIGYVDAKDLFQRALNNQPLSLKDGSLIRRVLIVPDKLTLAEVLDQFQQVREDFAVILNEYSLVVGVVTLNDVMSTVMGDLVSPDADEEQIVRRDANSWLIDGITPIDDVLHALQLDELPHDEEYATLAGFLMVMLRRVPRRTDSVDWGGYKFEVIDVDSYRIDQVLVTRLAADGTAIVPSAETAAAAE